MNAQSLQRDQKLYLQAMPVYLGIQATILLLTYLDSPAYLEAYERLGYLTAGGWLGVWFVLEIFGLASGLALWFSPAWKAALPALLRGKQAAGFLLGAVAGLVSLGLRFMPIMPSGYFWIVGLLTVTLACVYLVWNRRRQVSDDLFP